MTDRLFKYGSFEDEIMKSMSDTLVKYQKDMMYGHEKLAKAVDHLNAAAEIFDDTGFNKESEFITKLIEKIADDVKVQEGPKPVIDLGEDESIERLLEEELEGGRSKDPFGISKELVKRDPSEEIVEEDLFWQKDTPYKSEFEDMMLGLHDNPLKNAKAFKKKL